MERKQSLAENISSFKKRIKNREIEVSVVGLGYVGLPLSLLIARKGFKVRAFDISEERINLLSKGKSYIVDVEDKEIGDVLGKTFFPTNTKKDLKNVDVFIVSVPTPLNKNKTPNLKYINMAIRDIKSIWKEGERLFIFESTLPPGTTEEIIYKKFSKKGKKFYLCFSPERINPGSEYPLHEIPKVMSGIDEESLNLGVYFYSNIFSKIVPVSSTKTAELVKLLENTYRFINISFINEFAKLCHLEGVDVFEVIEAAKTKPYGFNAFYPGWGAGGECIPTVPLFLSKRSRSLGMRFSMVEDADIINESIPLFWYKLLKPYIRESVFFFGVSYKKDVGDLRNSPPLKLIEILIKKGLKVSFYDPFIEKIKINGKELKGVKPTEELIRNSDVIVIGTNHSTLPHDLILSSGKPVLDPFGILPPSPFVISFSHGKIEI